MWKKCQEADIFYNVSSLSLWNASEYWGKSVEDFRVK